MDKMILKGFFHFSIGPLLSAIISLITTPITTFLILPSEFGKASMYSVALFLIMQIVLLGTDQSFIRFFYQTTSEKRTTIFWNTLLPPLIMSFIVSSIIILFRAKVSYLLFGDDDHIFPVIILCFSIVFSVLSRFSALILRMKKRGVAYSIVNISGSIINASCVILFAFLLEGSFYAIILSSFFGTLTVIIISILLEIGFWRSQFKISLGQIKKNIFYGVPFVPAFLISWLFESMDKLALRSFSTFDEIGLYTAGNKITAVLTIIQTGFSTFWWPVALENYESAKSKNLYSKAAELLSGILFLVSFVTIALKDVIILILAKGYLPSSKIMPFLLFHPLMYTVSEVTVVGINFKKRTYWHVVISLISAGVNFIGNYFFVPLYGAKGAAFSTGIAYIVFFFIRTLISTSIYPVDYSLKRFTLGTIVLFIVSLINTFSGILLIEQVSAIIGGVIIGFVYRNEISYTYKTVVGIYKEVIGKRKLDRENQKKE